MAVHPRMAIPHLRMSAINDVIGVLLFVSVCVCLCLSVCVCVCLREGGYASAVCVGGDWVTKDAAKECTRSRMMTCHDMKGVG